EGNLFALAVVPPAIRRETGVGRGHHDELQVRRRGAKDLSGPARVVIAGDQQHLVSAELAQTFDGVARFLLGRASLVFKMDKVRLGIAGLYGKGNRQIALVLSIDSGRAADQYL